MSGYERTGWRDEEMSRRHRTWGFNCPGVNVDFLMLEYDKGWPVALIEFKHFNSFEAHWQNFLTANYVAQSELYDKHGRHLPFLVVKYWPDTWAMSIYPVNKAAQALWTPGMWTPMTERQFVETLYKLRDRVINEEILNRLNTHLPPDEEPF